MALMSGAASFVVNLSPKPMATPSRTNPTGAGTTLARMAIPIVPVAIPPHDFIVFFYTISHAHFSLRKFLSGYH